MSKLPRPLASLLAIVLMACSCATLPDDQEGHASPPPPNATGGARAPSRTGGASPSGMGGTGGSGMIITRDPGTCISDPGSDVCREVCNAETHEPRRLPPEILIVLDKSSSMNESSTNGPCGSGCVSKWSAVSSAIVDVVGATDSSANWGLKYFGSDTLCGVLPGVDVPVAPGNGAAIRASILAAAPASMTPTRLAEVAAVEYLKTLKTPNPKFIVLATDGLPNCGSLLFTLGDEAGTVSAVADARAAGFATFVVGISTMGSGADTTLNNMADAGGMARAGSTHYYPVAGAAELKDALANIAGQVATCTYPLSPASPRNDPNNVTVHVDNMTIQQDGSNGWDYSSPSHTAITFFGTACSYVKANAGAKVEIFYGCPNQPPVP